MGSLDISGIYLIENKVSGKTYIGKSKCIRLRRNRHFSDLGLGRHENKHLQNSWNKYGAEAFEFKVACECPEEKLLSIEQQYFDTYFSQELYNKDLTARETPLITKPVKCYTMDGEFIKRFNSIREAAKWAGCKENGITPVCRGQNKSCGGYRWSYAEEELVPWVGKKKGAWCQKRVLAVSNDGTEMIFDCLKDTANYYNVSVTTIFRMCHGGGSRSIKDSLTYL